MALIECPDCHAQVSDKAPTCPKCGRPIAQEGQSETEPETILYQGSPVMFRNRPLSFILCFLLIILSFGMGLIVLLRWYQGSPVMFHNYPISLILCPLLILIFAISLIILLRWWLTCKDIQLEITNKRTTLRTGLLAKNTIELRHKDIRSVVVRQSFIQRIFGVGIIELSSAAEADFEIAVSGLRDPQRVAEMIQQHQER